MREKLLKFVRFHGRRAREEKARAAQASSETARHIHASLAELHDGRREMLLILPSED